MDRSLKVLVVEDDELAARTMASLLVADGHVPVVVHNGRQAIERLADGRIDLLITDIYMPDMDGIELLRRLRRQERLPPIIAVSGGGRTVQVDYLDLAQRLGACQVLRKPFTRRVLGAAIRAAMDTVEVTDATSDEVETAALLRHSEPPLPRALPERRGGQAVGELAAGPLGGRTGLGGSSGDDPS